MGKARAPTTPRTVRCYHCQHAFGVSARAQTGSCPECYKKLLFDHVVIKSVHSVRKLQTCGKLLVQKKGRVIADRVDAQEGIEVLGVMEAKQAAAPSVVIAKGASWKGDCTTPTLDVHAGARVLGGLFCVQPGSTDGA